MENNINKLLADILICINSIENYTGREKNYFEYEKNFLLQDAVERNIITIGEAVNALLKIKPTIAITDARKIVNARNRLTHGYNDIENVQIWNIIIVQLPTLKAEVENLLSK
jgi:uncharacterized protein with HEPN domain